MIDACYCDTNNATAVAHTEIRKARKEHRCDECRGTIRVGERYRHVWGVWPDGVQKTHRACRQCLDALKWVEAHDCQTCFDATSGECADRLERLRAMGYRVPQSAIDQLRSEHGYKG